MIDIENSLIQADNDNRISMLLHRKVAEIMARVNSDIYWPYISYFKKGVPDVIHMIV
jgi:hypothetical protein